MKAYQLAVFSLMLISQGVFSQTSPSDDKCNGPAGSDVIVCYRDNMARKPLEYNFLSNEELPREYRYLLNDLVPARYEIDAKHPPVEVNRYKLVSQSWSPDGLVSPDKWAHHVNIYIPKHPKGTRALIAIDLSEKMMIEIAQATNTVVVSLDNIPAIGLVYQGDGISRIEDDSIARSWKLYLEHPENREQLPLQVPMSEAVSQTIRLATKELRPLNIDKFIITGASKRGWTSWLSGISDPAVEAIVPFVTDLLSIQDVMKHMYQTYGGNWPIAFNPYYQNQIDSQINSPNFDKLVKIIDPMQYLNTDRGARLAIPKYIVNASGDDFFPADDSRYYYDQLPGEKSLRIAPNTDHNGIVNFTQQSLITFINRLQENRALPYVTVTPSAQEGTTERQVSFSEKPSKVVAWTAVNKDSRDFRYACGIRYTATPVELSPQNTATLSLDYKGAGWQAKFIEATFADGYVATSQVYITPDAKYPTTAPAGDGKSCQTVPGRAALN